MCCYQKMQLKRGLLLNKMYCKQKHRLIRSNAFKSLKVIAKSLQQSEPLDCIDITLTPSDKNVFFLN